MIKINGKDYESNTVKTVGTILMPIGIIITIISLLLSFAMPLAGCLFISVGLMLVYVSKVYKRALKEGYGDIDFKKLLTILLLVMFPVIGLIYMFVAKTVKNKNKQVVIVIISILWFFFSLLLYATANDDTNETANNEVVTTTATTVSSTIAKTEAITTAAAVKETEPATIKVESTTEAPATQPSNNSRSNEVPASSNDNASKNTATKAASNSNKEFPTAAVTATTSGNNFKYVLNTDKKRMKIHSPSCADVKKISAENYSEYSGDIEELLSQGYTPCGHCHAGQ